MFIPMQRSLRGLDPTLQDLGTDAELLLQSDNPHFLHRIFLAKQIS